MAGLLKAAQRDCPEEKGLSLRLLWAALSQAVLSSALTAVVAGPTQAQMFQESQMMASSFHCSPSSVF